MPHDGAEQRLAPLAIDEIALREFEPIPNSDDVTRGLFQPNFVFNRTTSIILCRTVTVHCCLFCPPTRLIPKHLLRDAFFPLVLRRSVEVHMIATYHLTNIAHLALTPQSLHSRLTGPISPNCVSISPVGKLPVELLVEIFLCCFYAVLNDRGPFIPPSAKTAPLLLCNVCQLWRSTALSMPELWCSMEIDIALSPRFIDTWLSRSGASPLSIAFTIEPRKKTLPFLPKHSPKSYEHFHVIFPLSHRWSNLKMTIFPGAPLSLLGNLGADALPCLEMVKLDHPLGFYMESQGSPLDYIFQSSSRLQLFSSSGIQNTNISTLPLSGLRAFCSDTLWSLANCLELLSRLPKLRLGMLCVIQGINEAPWSSDPVVLKDLEILSISFVTPVPGIFTHLTLPALKSLAMDFGVDASLSHTTFLSFSSVFSAQLHSLRLDRPPISEDDLIEYLRPLRSLAYLILRDRPRSSFIGDRLLTSLTCIGGDASYLCPELVNLGLLDVHACTDERLVNMVESRWKVPTPEDSDIDTVRTT